jgi:hypothetical protein
MQRKEQCKKCSRRLFFKPLPDETFACCLAYGETAHDIDIKTGMSPKIVKYWKGEILCKPFKPGKSPCCTLKENPFVVPAVRLEGERILLRRLISTEP